MKYNFTITIRNANGETYTCQRVANTEEQALSMIKLPDGETLLDVKKDWANPNY